ncbi:hypothetical protein IV102_24650 [bacterium]|nr:hypothetical protein [bacterium]
MVRITTFLLLLTSILWARPVSSPRGLVSFDVPENLAQRGGSSWGVYPGVVIEMREEFAPGKELKDLILSMCPTTGSGKKSNDGAEVDGLEGQVVGKTEGPNFSKYLFVKRGNYHYGWGVTSNGQSKEEIEAVFDRLRQSIKFNPDLTESSENDREVRDPSGALQIRLPASFGSSNGRKYSNGQMMVILTPLREATPDTERDFAFKYTPAGYKSYMRRSNVEMGNKTGGLILATSDDGTLESQMVMLVKDKSAVVLTFIAPIKLRGQLSVLRESVAGQARWTKE